MKDVNERKCGLCKKPVVGPAVIIPMRTVIRYFHPTCDAQIRAKPRVVDLSNRVGEDPESLR